MIVRMFPSWLSGVCSAAMLALLVLFVSAPPAVAHPVPHPAVAVPEGLQDLPGTAVDAASCCHVNGSCALSLPGHPVGLSWHICWSGTDLRLPCDARSGSLARGTEPPPPRG